MGIRVFSTIIITAFTAIAGLSPAPTYADDTACQIDQGRCALDILEHEAQKIENTSWRDQTYRELAKLLVSEGLENEALAVLPKIETPDTVALTIRGIGVAAAEMKFDSRWTETRYEALFTALRSAAEKIEHPPSYAIALTYIAMGQAFAGNNDGAWATAADMENDSLRHKAYGETAEIQAENGDASAAMKSIALIDSLAYRNKAYVTISKILADQKNYQEAFQAAIKVDNPYKKAQSIQYLMNVRRHYDLKDHLENKE